MQFRSISHTHHVGTSVVLDVLRVILEVKEMLVELELCVTDTLVEVPQNISKPCRGVQWKKCEAHVFTARSESWFQFLSKVRAVPLEMNFSCHRINGTPWNSHSSHLFSVEESTTTKALQRPSLSRGSSAKHRQRLPCLLLANCLQLGGPRDLETS